MTLDEDTDRGPAAGSTAPTVDGGLMDPRSHGQDVPPWLRPDLLPEKPGADLYGYWSRNVFTPCSREALIERCSTDKASESMVVWAPDFDRLVPAVELPFLQSPLREQSRKTIQRNLKIACFSSVLYGLPALMAFRTPAFESHLLLLLSVALIPLAEGWWELRQLEDATAQTWPARIVSARYAIWVSRQLKEATWFLVAVIGAVFVFQLVHGFEDSITRAGLTKGRFEVTESYRFLTGPLMHGSVWHIVFNALAFFVLGSMVEALLGSAGMILIFVASALGGSVFSFFFITNTSVGASGGIMGLLGCLLIFGIHFRKILPPKFARRMIYCLFITLATGLVASHVVDNAAHVGGFLTGAALGDVLIYSHRSLPIQLSLSVRWAGRLALILVLIALLIATKRLWPG